MTVCSCGSSRRSPGAHLGDAVTFAIGVGLHESRRVQHFASLAYRWSGVEGVLVLKGLAIPGDAGILVASSTRFPRLFVWEPPRQQAWRARLVAT